MKERLLSALRNPRTPSKREQKEQSYSSFTLAELTGSLSAPAQPDIEGSDDYENMFMTYRFRLYQDPSCTRFCGDPVSVLRVHQLLHWAAPSKRYKEDYDKNDTISDWATLYNGTDHENRRLHRHGHIPNWHLFERRRLELLTLMNMGSATHNITPILAFDRPFAWNMDQWTVPEIMEGHFFPELGPLVIAAFSPDITQTWGVDLGITGQGNGKQDMGPTQALPLVLWKMDELLNSRIATALKNKMSG